ncbi:UDP-glucose 4-epimerase [Hypsibius exemplaris]|uniref:UDP-glucose 4-epimerase n=1 Tax=Hypsibius exemplaris TaxID=2072580 RepID=A0A1W0X7H3_HYPEX|nr:UDP-glucose 4-epimerase [Hypsibius exemplaris]
MALNSLKKMAQSGDHGRVVLVTGGAGYVGSHCILELLHAGFEVVAVDNFANAIPDESGKLPESLNRVELLTGKKCNFYQVDILDQAQLKSVFQEHSFFCIIHCAALKAVGESTSIPLAYYRTNLAGTLNLLEAAKEANVKRFVFSSSSTIYGTPQYLPMDEKHPVGVGIASPYGRSKHMVEEILQDLQKSDNNWDIIILRYFNPVGCHESGRIGEDPQGLPNNLMPFIAQVAVGRLAELKVFGSDYDTPDGTGIRDYVHVVDVAKAHVAAIKLFEKPFGLKTYNLGTGCGYSVLQVVSAFEKASDKLVKYKIVSRRVGDLATYYCDPSLAEKELGWKCQKNLADMCEDFWLWQSQNPNGFSPETNT